LAVKRFLDQLIARLEGKLEVLWDRNLLFASDEWRRKLYPCFGKSDAAVILLSRGALESQYVSLEAMVLMWRWVVDPKMVLIPVYFDGVNENSLKDPASRFYGVGLEELQAVKHEGDGAAALDAVEHALEKVADTAALEHIAAVKKLALRLEGIDPAAMDDAADAIGAGFEEWGAPHALQLALALLRKGLLLSIEAIRRLDLSPDKRSEVVNLLRSTWVNMAASAPVYRYHGVDPAKPVLVIDGRYPQTAEDYVSRAWSQVTGSTPGLIGISGISGGNGLKDQVLEAFWRKLPPAAWEASTGGWNDDARGHALSAIRKRGSQGQPVYVWIKCAAGVNPDEVAALRNDLPQITILFLCAQAPADAARFLETKPRLTKDVEDASVEDYWSAHSN
jgi:hypothetical protein